MFSLKQVIDSKLSHKVEYIFNIGEDVLQIVSKDCQYNSNSEYWKLPPHIKSQFYGESVELILNDKTLYTYQYFPTPFPLHVSGLVELIDLIYHHVKLGAIPDPDNELKYTLERIANFLFGGFIKDNFAKSFITIPLADGNWTFAEGNTNYLVKRKLDVRDNFLFSTIHRNTSYHKLGKLTMTINQTNNADQPITIEDIKTIFSKTHIPNEENSVK